MTAPARARATVSRSGTAERPSESKSTKTRARTPTRTRSAAAERAYARREERKSAREAPERSREEVPRPKAQPARPKAKQLQVKVATTRMPLVVAGMSMLGVGLVTTLWLSIATVGGSYEIQRSERDITTLSEQKKDLVRQNSTMDATPALLNRALKQGLVPGPAPAHVIKHPDGSTSLVGDPTSAPEAPPARQQDVPDPQVEAR